MSPSTLDSIVPAIIFGSTVAGTFMLATAPDLQSAVMGISILVLAFMVCYYEFSRTVERIHPNKID
jgi:hypothetical protein